MTRKQTSILASGLLSLFLLVTVSLALAALGSHRANLSETTTDVGYPAVAVSHDGDKVGIVWAERRVGGLAVQGPIYFRGGDISDGAFSSKIVVDDAVTANDQSLTPDIAADPNTTNNMHLTWKNIAANNNIYYALCTVTSPICTETLVKQADTGDTADDPVVATSNNSGQTGVHAVWRYDDVNGAPRTQRIRYSGKNGAGNFSADVLISGIDTGASQPSIATAKGSDLNNYAHVVWVNDNDGDSLNEEVRYVRGLINSGSGVVTWGTPKSLTGTLNTSSNPDYPTVVAAGDAVMVLWDVFAGNEAAHTNPANDQYYAVYSISTDNGATFLPNALDITTGSDTLTARQADNDPTSSADGNPIRQSVHAGRLQIQATVEITTNPDILGIVHAVWQQSVQNGALYRHDLYYSRYLIDSGTCIAGCDTWAAEQNETGVGSMGGKAVDDAYSVSPAIGAGPDNKLHVAYMESNSEGGFRVEQTLWDVFYNRNFIVDTNNDGMDDLNIPPVVPPTSPKVFLPVILKSS